MTETSSTREVRLVSIHLFFTPSTGAGRWTGSVIPRGRSAQFIGSPGSGFLKGISCSKRIMSFEAPPDNRGRELDDRLVELRERYVDQRKAPASAVHLQMAGTPLTSGLLGQE